MTVVTRFAPSPTGYLHIGGARTALFNWLYARHNGGKFLLRIEDTDRARSTDDAVEKIFEGMRWLGLDWDDEPVMQFSRAARHAEVAERLLEDGKAYRCTCSPEELADMREKARAEGRPTSYDGRCRDAGHGTDKPFVVRLKAEKDGQTVIDDQVQGPVTVANETIDDMVLLRADGTPTYMLSVVVDDHDMGVTHIIRGDDHLTNATRQAQIYKALGWTAPVYAHIPLIHGPDGTKLSKRHGALGVEAYRDMGLLPEAVRNYLLKLGWSHGDDEIISTDEAISWFDLDGIGKAPARFDIAKLTNLNAHYIKEAENDRLIGLIGPMLEEKTGAPLSDQARDWLGRGLDGLKDRAKTTLDLVDSAAFYVAKRPLSYDEKAAKQLTPEGKEALTKVRAMFADLTDWSHDGIEAGAKALSEETGLKLGKLFQPLRAALTGMGTSPSMMEVAEILGRDECLGRIDDALAYQPENS